MAKTIKYYVHLQLLRARQEGAPWVAGGVIEDHVRGIHDKHPKGGTVGRALRAMTEPGEDDKPAHLLKKIENGFVWYRINPDYDRPIIQGKPLADAFEEKPKVATAEKLL